MAKKLPKVVPTQQWWQARSKELERRLHELGREYRFMVKETLRYRRALHQMCKIAGRNL